jgi:hypothetical protein
MSPVRTRQLTMSTDCRDSICSVLHGSLGYFLFSLRSLLSALCRIALVCSATLSLLSPLLTPLSFALLPYLLLLRVSVFPSMPLSACLSVCLICPSACLSVSLSVYLSAYLSVTLFVCSPVSLSRFPFSLQSLGPTRFEGGCAIRSG